MSKKEDTTSALTLMVLFVACVVALLLFFMALFFVAPGAVVTALIIQTLGQQVDAAQAWIFAALFSAIIGMGYYAYFRDPQKTQKAYLLTCAIVAGVYALASLGFHAEWSNAHLAHYLPNMKNKQGTGSADEGPPRSLQPARGAIALDAKRSPPGVPAQRSTSASMGDLPTVSVPTLREPTLLPATQAGRLPSSIVANPVEQVTRPSFDCDKSQLRVEKMICASQKLSAMDHQLHALYREVRLSAVAGNIKADQIQWLKQYRNVCDDAVCLLAVYQDRLEQLQRQTIKK